MAMDMDDTTQQHLDILTNYVPFKQLIKLYRKGEILREPCRGTLKYNENPDKTQYIEGKVRIYHKPPKTGGGGRNIIRTTLYCRQDVIEFLNKYSSSSGGSSKKITSFNAKVPSQERGIIGYLRVSLLSQQHELTKQKELINKYRPDIKTFIEDISPGTILQRDGLDTIKKYAIQRTIREVVIIDGYQICSISGVMELFRAFLGSYGVTLTILSETVLISERYSSDSSIYTQFEYDKTYVLSDVTKTLGELLARNETRYIERGGTESIKQELEVMDTKEEEGEVEGEGEGEEKTNDN